MVALPADGAERLTGAAMSTPESDIHLEACENSWLLYPRTDEARAWLEEYTEGAERPYVISAGVLVEVLAVVLAAGFTVR